MTEKIIIAGSGGQGIMLLGKVLAQAAMRENKSVTWLPAYGAEVRGGTAYCMVIISDEEISSPYIDKADSLIVMNGCSLRKFQKKLKHRGLLIVNDSLVDGKEDLVDNNSRIVKRRFTDMAVKSGNVKVANMISLGCYIRESGSVQVESVLSAIEENAPVEKKYLIQINKQAIFAGMECSDNG